MSIEVNRDGLETVPSEQVMTNFSMCWILAFPQSLTERIASLHHNLKVYVIFLIS